jgi:hypothetical protein
MNTVEFSNEFDVLYNNIMSNAAPGLNEYEKSVFLTKAQDEIIKNHFNANSNILKEGFDASAKRQIDFSSLLFTKQLKPITKAGYSKIHPKSSLFKVDASILMIVNESVVLSTGQILSVLPISYLDINSALNKPYKFPPKFQAWRYFNNIESDSGTSGDGKPEYSAWEVISSTILGITGTPPEEGQIISEEDIKDLYDNVIGKRRERNIEVNVANNTYKKVIETCRVIDSYVGTGELIAEIVTAYPTENCSFVIRYVRRPNPIVLVNLKDDYDNLSINGCTDVTECELDVSLHTEILQRAVELAKAAYTGDINSVIEMGKRSE